jgi:hypothetical protein
MVILPLVKAGCPLDDIELFLKALAARVVTANMLQHISPDDLSDFRIWLLRCAEKARNSTGLESFFDGL